jgi:hypothetical protein
MACLVGWHLYYFYFRQTNDRLTGNLRDASLEAGYAPR